MGQTFPPNPSALKKADVSGIVFSTNCRLPFGLCRVLRFLGLRPPTHPLGGPPQSAAPASNGPSRLVDQAYPPRKATRSLGSRTMEHGFVESVPPKVYSEDGCLKTNSSLQVPVATGSLLLITPLGLRITSTPAACATSD